MKTLLSAFLLMLATTTQGKSITANSPLCFIENKGQINDQHYNSRTDIDYVVRANGMNIFIGAGSIHYQFDAYIKVADTQRQSTYRMDMTLIGTNTHAVVTSSQAQPYYEHYYTPGCGDDGCIARTCRRITYTDIYPGIDWILYIKGNTLKHEFVVNAGANPAMIRMRYDGAGKLTINADGSLTATTPFGKITEQAPVSYANGTVVNTSYQLQANTISFHLGEYTGNLTIDPELAWGTYYAGCARGNYASTACDKAGNVYITGVTQNTHGIATTGSFLDTNVLMDPHNQYAYLVKFDSNGVRQWGTYYGGSATPGIIGNGQCQGIDVVCDTSGNVYITGSTTSDNNIATPGSHQPTPMSPTGTGANNAYLAKFNTHGSRIWATYYGNNGTQGNALAVDKQNNVFMSGSAAFSSTSSLIATPGAYKETWTGIMFSNDAFLVKFDSNGVRQWGTYYGGPVYELIFGACTDESGSIYISGSTSSSSEIATPGSHQLVMGGGSTDGFLAKFNSMGVHQWATYYGDTGTDGLTSLTAYAGGIYVAGHSNGTSNIASPGSYQPLYGGGSSDAFLAKFNTAGVRQWSTYYGGNGSEKQNYGAYGPAVTSDITGNIYLAGYTSSTTGIATPYSYQQHYGGGAYDAYLARFDTAGNRLWGTYYGDCGEDGAADCAADNFGNVYVMGFANSLAGIATPGSHQTEPDTVGWHTYPFYPYNIVLAKFNNRDRHIMGDTSICAGSTTIYYIPDVPGAVSYTWSLPAGWSGISTTDSIEVTVGDAGGDIQVIVNKACSADTERILHVTILPLPTPTVTQTGTTLSVAPAYVSYQWYQGTLAIGGATNQTYIATIGGGSYNVVVADTNGCSATGSIWLGIGTASPGEGIGIHPNPAQNQITITHAAGTDINIFNAIGQKVYTTTIKDPAQTISIAQLPAGVYIAHITDKNTGQSIERKLQKE